MKYDFYVFRENIFFYENLSIAEERGRNFIPFLSVKFKIYKYVIYISILTWNFFVYLLINNIIAFIVIDFFEVLNLQSSSPNICIPVHYLFHYILNCKCQRIKRTKNTVYIIIIKLQFLHSIRNIYILKLTIKIKRNQEWKQDSLILLRIHGFS